jgi:hypothetical protein
MPHWVHVYTGLKTVMPPFVTDPARSRPLLDSVPVSYLLVQDGDFGRYLEPVVRGSAEWERVFVAPAEDAPASMKVELYRRAGRGPAQR